MGGKMEIPVETCGGRNGVSRVPRHLAWLLLSFLLGIQMSCGGAGVAILPPAITTASLPLGAVGTAYSSSLDATGGVAPYTWSITSGALPAGLMLNPANGAITGTPAAYGAFNPTFQVSDAKNRTAAANLGITIIPALIKLSTDTFTNNTSQHATEVEPDTFSFGSTIVSAFQIGRLFGGGSSDIGFATSTDGGVTWTSGLLSGLTIFQGGTSLNAVSDPAVAYDPAHGQWIIASIAVQEDAAGDLLADQILVNRSPDGLSWGSPIAVNPLTNIPPGYDKDWIVCDTTATSPFYGHCYVQWDSLNHVLLFMTTSTDGGLTWQAPLNTADMVHGSDTQALVQPNGTVIVPMAEQLFSQMLAFTSTDGGASWNASTVISTITDHTEAGNLRSNPLPSAQIDAAGTVYVVWADCRFRTNCTSNDLVLSTSSDGVTWTPPARIPIDPVSSTVDHFIPGLAVDRTTSGNTAHLTLTYYYYPISNCGMVCDLYVGFVTSQDGGQSWSAPVQLAAPMSTAWLPNTSGGVMVGDYISGSYVSGNPFAVFAVAAPNSGAVFDEAMYTTAQPMLPSASLLRFSSQGEMPVPNAKSDHEPRRAYPPQKRPPSSSVQPM
jgi:Putative Ig domain